MRTKLIETVIIPATKGTKVITDSKLFSYIDSDFKKWGADKKEKKHSKTILEIREITEHSTFAQMMSPENILTQEQILYFVEHHKDKLRSGGYATFFPFKSSNEVFVAGVDFLDGGSLHVDVRRFDDGRVWAAGRRRRVVVPQLALNTSASESLALRHSDTLVLPLELRIKALEEKIEKLVKIINI